MLLVQRQASCGQATTSSPRCEAPVPAAGFGCVGSRHVQQQQRQGTRRHSQSCTVTSQQLNRNANREALLYPPSPPSLPSSSNLGLDPSAVKVDYPTKCLDWEREEINAHIDILGIAQSMVDVTTDCCGDELLQELNVKKGGRRVLGTVEERSQVLNSLEEAGISTQITAGGSLANTLVGIGRLSAAYTAIATATRRTPGSPPPSPAPPLPSGLNVALGTSCSSDALGQFFSSQLSSAGVTLVPTHDPPPPGTPHPLPSTSDHIGTVFVLASPDAQRSFLSFFTAEPMSISNQLREAITRSRLVVVEGYLWELEGAAQSIAAVLAAARAGGAQVALTAGDAGVVARNREAILKVLQDGGHDILFFANCEEACELLGRGSACSARSAAQALGSLCSIAVVTDGRAGSHISYLGSVASLPPAAVPRGVKDTCGAGDAYAAGFCFAHMMGYDCVEAGTFASNVAVRVISRHGAQLHEAEALELVQVLEELAPRSRRTPSWPASFHSSLPLISPNTSD